MFQTVWSFSIDETAGNRRFSFLFGGPVFSRDGPSLAGSRTLIIRH
jgi:hypothetical protein